jgi:hypothetical protein
VEAESARASEPATLAQQLHGSVLGAAQVLKGLIGEVGAHALLSRAVHLMRAARTNELSAPAPALTGQHLKDVRPWQDLVEQQGAALARQQAENLLEHAITLLCGFIGTELTFRVFSRSYPGFRADETSHDPAEGQDS